MTGLTSFCANNSSYYYSYLHLFLVVARNQTVTLLSVKHFGKVLIGLVLLLWLLMASEMKYILKVRHWTMSSAVKLFPFVTLPSCFHPDHGWFAWTFQICPLHCHCEHPLMFGLKAESSRACSSSTVVVTGLIKYEPLSYILKGPVPANTDGN